MKFILKLLITIVVLVFVVLFVLALLDNQNQEDVTIGTIWDSMKDLGAQAGDTLKKLVDGSGAQEKAADLLQSGANLLSKTASPSPSPEG